MIGELIRTFARQRLHSPMRVILALMFIGFGGMMALVSSSIEPLNKSIMVLFAFVFAAGAIGQDVSSGVLTLTFARPIRRSEYVIARWLGASTLASACVILQVLFATAMAAARHGDLDATHVGLKILEGVLASFGTSAVVTMFSALVPGLADLGLFLLTSIVGFAISAIGNMKQIGWLARIGAEIQRFLDASVNPAPLFGQDALSWFAIASYLSTVTLCLVLAIWSVNRKELSYASG